MVKVMEPEKRTLFLTVGVSLLCHLIFFGMMLFWPSRSPAIRFTPPSAIQVDMVSLPMPIVQPAGKPLAPPPEAAPVETTQPAEIKPEMPKPEIIIPEKTEPEAKIEEPVNISNEPPKHIEPQGRQGR